MPNYYEMLKVQPTAPASEIETAIGQQYNQWRRLVAHRDPAIVNQANQALMTLEQIRSTLMDSTKRAVYDSAIGVSGQQLGGLADPEMLLRANPLAAPMSPPASAVAKAQQQMVERTDAWICTNPQCRKANPIGQQFCSQCGTLIGYACPKCGKLSELSKRYCPHCGVAKEEHFRMLQQNRISELQQLLQDTQAKIGRYQSLLQKFNISGRSVPEITMPKPGGLSTLLTYLIVFGVPIGLWWISNKLGNVNITLFLVILFIAYIGLFALFAISWTSMMNLKTVKPQIRALLTTLESEVVANQQAIARVQTSRYGEDQQTDQ